MVSATVCVCYHSASCVPWGKTGRKAYNATGVGKVVIGNPGQKQHADRTVFSSLSVSVSDVSRLGEAEQQVAIVFVLLRQAGRFHEEAFAD